MKIVSGFLNPHTTIWNEMLENLRESAERFGHQIEIHKFPIDDPWMIKYPYLYRTICWKYKIHFIQEILSSSGEDIIWIDGDCLIKQALDFDQIVGTNDMAFTLRDIKDRKNSDQILFDGLINTGVMFFRNNLRTNHFLLKVTEILPLSVFDQDAINKILFNDSELDQHNVNVLSHGAWIRILNCRDYNFFYFEDDPRNAKILHFKGTKRRLYANFVH